jgi:hypothetical protein
MRVPIVLFDTEVFGDTTNRAAIFMGEQFALLSVVFMMGFVMVFDRMHWRRKNTWFWKKNLMTQEDLDRIMRILEASQET